MKRNFVVLIAIIIVMTLTVNADGVIMFSCDGREISVDESEVEAYSAVGWYTDYEDVTVTVYATDGRSAVIFKGELPIYKELGWYDRLEDVTSVVYALDGRSATVYKADVPAYKAVGWYDSYEDVVTTVYAPDGRSAVIYKAEVPAYKAVGWYENIRFIDPDRPMVALTYDDGPSEYTSLILDTLIKYNAAATFFVVGQKAAVYTYTIARENESGMEIANHTYSHPYLTKISAREISSQITRTDNAVYNACGKKPTLLRPPYGAHNKTVRNSAGKPLILWSLDTRDWESRNADKVYEKVMNNVKDGDIILMHDLYRSTADATARIVPELIKKGFQLVTVSELASYKSITLKNGYTYTNIK